MTASVIVHEQLVNCDSEANKVQTITKVDNNGKPEMEAWHTLLGEH